MVTYIAEGAMSDLANNSNSSTEILSAPIEDLNLSKRPYNALKRAGIHSLWDLLKARSRGLEQIGWLGEKSINEVENALAQFLGDLSRFDEGFLKSSGPLTDEELEYLKDPRPFLITVDFHSIPNLVKLMVPFSKSLLKLIKHDRDLEVLKRRYGLEDSGIYTQQEIGYYYDITRERVRQIESKAKRKIRETLLGFAESKHWRVPENVVEEANDLSSLLRSRDRLLTEQEIIQIVEDRYDFKLSAGELQSVRFLLSVLGFHPLPKGIADFSGVLSPAWVMTDNLEKPILYRAIKSVYGTLKALVTPLSFFDLKIEVNRRRKKKIDAEYVRFAIKACYEIESVNQETYQIKFEYLPSLADKAYRILCEANETMHIRDICRQTNHRLAKAGFPANVRRRGLGTQLAADPRFEPIGHSGIWSLSEWEYVRRDTIVGLLQEFFHYKQTSAIVDEAYEYISSRRPDISKRSVAVYLSAQKDIFIRVSETKYELSAWGGKPYKPIKRPDAKERQKRLESEIKGIFADKQATSLPLRELVHELAGRTGIPTGTVYRGLRQSPLVALKPHPSHLRAKIAQYTGNDQAAVVTTTTTTKTLRETVQQEIENYLRKQPNRRALVADVASYVMKRTNCKRPTFYRYLSEMEMVNKEYDNNKLYCYIATEEASTPLSFPRVKRMDVLITQPEVMHEHSIADLIKLGESATLEFKSTLQWDVTQNQVNKALRFSVLKTIAAFLNSEGGTLIIGVEDNGAVCGLGRDLRTVHRQSLDGFEQLLNNLISDRIGVEFARFIKIRFEQLEGESVCAVDVEKAPEPAFMDGLRGKEFFVRHGNTTRALNPEEMHRYVQMNWE